MDILEGLILTMIFGILLIGIANHAFAQEAVSGVNNAFDGVSNNLRGVLDGIFAVEQFFANFSCHLQGIFGGYHNLPEGSICL